MYGFKAVDKFDKAAVQARTELYLKLARSIWNVDSLKKLAGCGEVRLFIRGNQQYRAEAPVHG